MERHPRAAKTMSPEECGDLGGDLAPALFGASEKKRQLDLDIGYGYIKQKQMLDFKWIGKMDTNGCNMDMNGCNMDINGYKHVHQLSRKVEGFTV